MTKRNKKLSILGIILFQVCFFHENRASAQIDTAKNELHIDLNEVVVQTNKLDKRKLLIEQIRKFATKQIDTNVIYEVSLVSEDKNVHLAYLAMTFKNGSIVQTLVSLSEDTLLIDSIAKTWFLPPLMLYMKNPVFLKSKAFKDLLKGRGNIDLKATNGNRFYEMWSYGNVKNKILSNFLFDNLGTLKEYNSYYIYSKLDKYTTCYKNYKNNAFPETIIVSDKKSDTGVYITFTAMKMDASSLKWKKVGLYQSFLFAYKEDVIGIKDYEINE